MLVIRGKLLNLRKMLDQRRFHQLTFPRPINRISPFSYRYNGIFTREMFVEVNILFIQKGHLRKAKMSSKLYPENEFNNDPHRCSQQSTYNICRQCIATSLFFRSEQMRINKCFNCRYQNLSRYKCKGEIT